MSKAKIQRRLEEALLHGGVMDLTLYEQELAGQVNDLRTSLTADDDDYIFSLTEHRGAVAMVLIEKSGETFVNEQARDRLQALWQDAYEDNIERLAPDFAEQLAAGEIPLMGVKVVRE